MTMRAYVFLVLALVPAALALFLWRARKFLIISRCPGWDDFAKSGKALVASGILLGVATGLMFVNLDAIRHGCNLNSRIMPPWVLSRHAALSPVYNTPPDDPSGKLFYFYKFTCPDCHAVAKDKAFQAAFRDLNPISIPSDSPEGKSLLKDYPIREVPSYVYIYPDGRNYVYAQVHRSDGNGDITYDAEAMEDFLSDMELIENTYEQE